LPVANEDAVKKVIMAGLALGCKIEKDTFFERKNYFYPDLPKAYQISQFDQPVNAGGFLEVELKAGPRRIGITRAHLEEDAGKLIHEGVKDGSLVDYNRAGMPLLEIVSEPEIFSTEEAYQYLTTLKAILQYLEVSDCDMEKGSLRCDANISVRPRGEKKLGTKVEIKNMNSFRAVERALQFEIERQTGVLTEGGRLTQETRLWDESRGETFSMRSKEYAHDYRYFPEPDLVSFTLSLAEVEAIRKTLPELPNERTQRLVKDYGISEYDAARLVQEKAVAEYYEACVKEGVSAKLAQANRQGLPDQAASRRLSKLAKESPHTLP